jgi:transcriptional regulator with XRE-family HTH domain
MDDGGRLAERLRAGLAAARLNQAELARRSGLTRAYVGRLLGGSQAAPTAEVVAALAAALDLAPAERLRLHAAAGLLPTALADLLDRPAVARLLIALAAAPPARQARLERLLTALLDAIESPPGE